MYKRQALVHALAQILQLQIHNPAHLVLGQALVVDDLIQTVQMCIRDSFKVVLAIIITQDFVGRFSFLSTPVSYTHLSAENFTVLPKPPSLRKVDVSAASRRKEFYFTISASF